jgi:hypothetical protein
MLAHVAFQLQNQTNFNRELPYIFTASPFIFIYLKSTLLSISTKACRIFCLFFLNVPRDKLKAVSVVSKCDLKQFLLECVVHDLKPNFITTQAGNRVVVLRRQRLCWWCEDYKERKIYANLVGDISAFGLTTCKNKIFCSNSRIMET